MLLTLFNARLNSCKREVEKKNIDNTISMSFITDYVTASPNGAEMQPITKNVLRY